MKKQKLSLDDLKVQSFVTEFGAENRQTLNVQGGFTGDCGTPLTITCGNCDLKSIPLNECGGGGSDTCTGSGCFSNPATCTCSA